MRQTRFITFFTLIIVSYFLPLKNVAQTIVTFDVKSDIPDHPQYTDDRGEEHTSHDNSTYIPLILNLPISGLPEKLDTAFGLEAINLTIYHTRISDIKIELLSPDGTLVWISNRNGKNGQNYENARFSQKGFSGPISSAEAPFEGDYQPDGNLSNFNNGQNPNGIWILRIHDLNGSRKDSLGIGYFQSISLSFSDNPARMNVSPCSVNNPKSCICSRPDGRLLPDLVVSANGTGSNMWEIAYDTDKEYGMLMLEVRTMNLGEGPIELEGTDIWLCGNDTVANRNVLCKTGDVTNDSVYPRQVFNQIIYQIKDGKMTSHKQPAGTMAYDGHPGHDHFHADYFARFTLYKPIENEPDTNKWEVIGIARKASFCLWDMQFCDDRNGKCDYNQLIYSEKNLLNYGFGTYQSCDDPHRQGISVGGIDWYGLHYDGQNLKLPKGTTNGLYFLKVEIDPFNHYEESNKTNNTVILPVVLRMQKG